MIQPKTIRPAVLILVTLVCLSSNASIAVPQNAHKAKPVEPWRKEPPKSGAARSFKLPASREIKLDNGLTLVFIEDHRAPVVTMMAGIRIEAVSSRDIAELTNDMALTEATAELIT